MHARDLRWGNAETLELRGAFGELDPIPRADVEVCLTLQGEDVTLSMKGRTWAVVGANPRLHAKLRDAAAERACVSWIAHASAERAIVQVRRFHAELRVVAPLAFRVDRGTREAVAGALGVGGTVPEIARRLDELLLLPARPGDADDLRRAVVVAGEGGAAGSFRMLGVRGAIDVETRAEALAIVRVVKGGPPRETATRLLVAPMSFVDASEKGALAASTRAELEAAVSASGSYLAIWEKYSKVDRQQTEDRAARFGALRYTDAARTPGGWKVDLAEDVALSERLEADPETCVVCTKEPPLPRAEHAEARESVRPREHRNEAVFRVVRVEGRVVHLRDLDEDRPAEPPERGYLSLSVHGDAKRIERREAAERRIREGDCPMDRRLGLILEGRPVPSVNYKRRSPESPAVREALGQSPTPKQFEAVRVALNTPDIAMIQGPPGTGKTAVITAIERRVAELADEDAKASQRILVTSAQHDAGENVAARSQVFDLPAIKVGHRYREGGAGLDQVALFQARQSERLRARLGTITESERLRRARDLAVSLVACATTTTAALVALRDLRAQVVDLVPPSLQDALDEEIHRLSHLRAADDDGGRELLLRAARGLREEPTAFEDDGPVKARVALVRLEGVLREDERRLLQRCADWDETGAPSWLAEVAALKLSILDRLLDAPTATAGGVEATTRELMTAVINALRAGLADRMTHEESVVATFLYDIETDPDGVSETLRHYTAVLAATLQQSAGRAMYTARSISEGGIEFNTVIVDEAARAHPLDLFIPMSMAERRIVLVGDQRQLPHMLEPEVERELVAGLSDGDLSQETEKALKESLFQRLWSLLKEQERRDGIPRTVRLDAQFRMHPALGAFVSRAFYECHTDGAAIRSPRPASEFGHGLAKFTREGRERVAAWCDVPGDRGRERRVGTSVARESEARAVAALARELLDADATLSVGVVAFYAAQVEAIQRALEKVGVIEREDDRWRVSARYAVGRDRRGETMERFRVGSVDAFQGKEFDVVILSITRSNTLPEGEPRKRYGHLVLDNRLCVAMSRQKRLLVVVGDLQFARRAAALAPIQKLISLCEGDHGVIF